MDDTAIFCLRGICNRQTAGRGRIRRKKSVETFPAPWSTTNTRVRVHVSEMKAAKKSSCDEPDEGAHMVAKATEIERWKAVMTTIPMIETIRIHLRTLNICKYRIRTEVLTRQIASGRSISTSRAV
jgi:hypothetical protein